MSSQQLDEERIFHTARLLPSHEAVADYLDQVCAGDQALRERVEALLQVHEKEQSFLKSDGDLEPTVDQSPITESPGQQIGRYKLLQKIGEGGFGVVYMAEQHRPIRRKVALKIIKPGMDTHAVVARFEAERQALAMMDHANIAHVLDGGATDSGRPYFVMELVRGVPITEYCDKNNLSAEERLQLFMTICQAVQHAHQKGVIHRDLKPSNVLVTLADGQPVVKVIDFGVAKATNQQLTEKTLFTAFGQMVGTPQYMSPEQAEMSCLDVDTRSDVYSLGVLLYELLTGTTPLEADRLRSAGYAEIQRLIREDEPPKPSIRLSTSGDELTVIAKHRSVTPQRLKNQVQGDLDWVVMKALEKDRNRRYESASKFANDVSSFLAGEPVEARPPTFGYRTAKYVRRNRLQIIVVGLVIISLVIGLGLAQRERLRAQGIATAMSRSLYASRMNAAMTAWESNELSQMGALLDFYEESDLRGWEWFYLDRLRKSMDVPVFAAQATDPLRISISSGGESVASSHARGGVFTVTRLGNSEANTIGEIPAGRWLYTFAEYSPDGSLIAHPSNDRRSLVIRDASSLEKKQEVLASIGGKGGTIASAAFSPLDNSIVVAVKHLGLLLLKPGAEVFEQFAQIADLSDFETLTFSANGKLLAVSSEPIKVFDFPSGALTFSCKPRKHRLEVISLQFVQDDSLLVSGSRDRTIAFWSTVDGQLQNTLGPFDGEVRALAYDRRTNRLAAGLRNRIVKIWTLPDLVSLPDIRGYGGMYAVEFDSNGRLFFGAFDGYVRVCEPDDLIDRNRLNIGGWCVDLTFSMDGRYLFALAYVGDGSNPEWGPLHLRVVDCRDADNPLIEMPRRFDNVSSIASSTNSNYLAIAERGTAKVQIVHTRSLELLQELDAQIDSEITAMAFQPRPNQLVCGFADGRVASIVYGNRLDVTVFADGHDGDVREVCVLEDGTFLTGSSDGKILRWNKGNSELIVDNSPAWVSGLSSHAGRFAYGLFGSSRSNGSQVFVRDLAGTEVGLTAHEFAIRDVQLMNQGKTLVTVGDNKEIKLWDSMTLEQRIVLRETEIFHALAISPNEETIAAGTREGSIFLYHAPRDN